MFYQLKYSQCFQGFQIEEHFFRKMVQLVLVELEPLQAGEIVQRALLDGVDLVVVQRSEKNERETSVTEGKKKLRECLIILQTVHHKTPSAITFCNVCLTFEYLHNTPSPSPPPQKKSRNTPIMIPYKTIDTAKIKGTIIKQHDTTLHRSHFVLKYLKTLGPHTKRLKYGPFMEIQPQSKPETTFLMYKQE